MSDSDPKSDDTDISLSGRAIARAVAKIALRKKY